MDASLYKFLKGLKIHIVRDGPLISVRSPNWLINPTLSIERYDREFTYRRSSALKDYASIAARSVEDFFDNPDAIDENCDNSLRFPLLPGYGLAEWFVPRDNCIYSFGSDLSVRGDRTGFAFSSYNLAEDTFRLEFSGEIEAGPGEVIDYDILDGIVSSISERGFRLHELVYDQFQSHYLITRYKKKGYDSRVVKYHESLPSNTMLRDFIMHKTLSYAEENKTFIGEAKELQVLNGKRIDHLSTGGIYNSKDVWDAIVNTMQSLLELRKKVKIDSEYIFPSEPVKHSFTTDLNLGDEPEEFFSGIAWSTGRTFITTSRFEDGMLKIEDLVAFNSARVSEQAVLYLRGMSKKSKEYAVVGDRAQQYNLIDLETRKLDVSSFDFDKHIRIVIESIYQYFTTGKVIIAAHAEEELREAILNVYKDEKSMIQCGNSGPFISFALSTVGFVYPNMYSKVDDEPDEKQ